MNELDINNITSWLTEAEREKIFSGGTRTKNKDFKVDKAPISEVIRKKMEIRLNGVIRNKLNRHEEKVITIICDDNFKKAFKDKCGDIPMSRVARSLMANYMLGEYDNV